MMHDKAPLETNDIEMFPPHVISHCDSHETDKFAYFFDWKDV